MAIDERETRPAPRLLVVEDDPELRAVLAEGLEAAGFRVIQAADGAVALDALRRWPFDGMVLDHEMPRMKGLELLSILRERGSRIPVVVWSGSLKLAPEECRRLGIGSVLPKPCSLSHILEALRDAPRPR